MDFPALNVFNQLTNPVVIASPEGKLVFANDAVRNLILLSNEKPDTGLFRTYLKNIRAITHQLATDALQNDRLEFPLRYKDEVRWILWSVSRSEDGDWIGVGTDVTEKRLRELEARHKNKELAYQQREVISSIQYAQRIQEAILPDISRLEKYFQGAFVYYQPRDIVSGDFYWTARKENFMFIAVADCTGHGVPGAMMSMMGYSFLDNAVRKRGLTTCSEILTEVDNEIQVVLNQNNNEARDGMDISLVRIDLTSLQLQFAGAMRAGYILRDDVLLELPASKYPLGFFDHIEKVFTNQDFQLKAGDNLFLFTDGVVDQFGGENDKKFNKKRFKEVLGFLGQLPSEEQGQYVEYVFQNWKQQTEQTDDVTVLGITI